MTVDEAITCIPGWKHASSLTVAPLPGGITNTNYRVDIGQDAFVLRVWAADAAVLGIDRQREYRCTLAASRVGVAPEVVYFLPDAGLMVTRFLPGQSLSPEAMARPDVMERAVGAMRRYHGGPAFDDRYSPFRAIEAYIQAAGRDRTALPADIDALHAQAVAIEAALAQSPAPPRPCHNDLWGSNMIDDGAQVRIVDWEYAGAGDVFFDLANYAIYGCATDALVEALLRGYLGAVPPPAFARLKLLEIVAGLREALWYVVARSVSTRWPDYAEHAQTHFGRCRRRLSDPRLAGWLRQVRGGS